MEVTSRDGNMVVDFYPVKDMNNNLIANRMLKVLSFKGDTCLLYTSPSPRDATLSRMPSSA